MSKDFVIRRGSRNLNQGPLMGLNKEQVDFETSGDNEIVPAVIGRQIIVHTLVLVIAEEATLRIYSGPSSENNPLSGRLVFTSNAALVLDDTNVNLECESGKSFVINLSDDVIVGGWIQYSVR